MALGFLTPPQLEEGLRKQEALRASGAKTRLGETFMLLKILELEQVRRVLSEQRKRRQGEADKKMPVEQFGEYQLVERLGEGGMGAVYKARDVLTGRLVALKVLRKGLAVEKDFVARFDRELRTAERLAHPNIVGAFSCGTLKGIQYLAMEYVEGETLYQKILREKAVEEREAVRIAQGVAQGLGHAHKLGLIHRDVKPENVLLGKQGQVKLADLGLARSVLGDTRLTKTGEVIGTPYYLAPEQALGLKEIGPPADLYALGATLYHALTGQMPFNAPSALDILMLHIRDYPVPLKVLRPSLSGGTVRVVDKLMAKDPAERYASAEELLEDLARLARGEEPPHAPPGLDLSHNPWPAMANAKTDAGAEGKKNAEKGGCLTAIFMALLCAIAIASSLSIVLGAEQTAENRAAVEVLIGKLSSKDYEAREAATAVLKGIGEEYVPLVEKKWGECDDLEIKQRLFQVFAHLSPLQALAADYQALGLPLPPNGAKLVKFRSERGTMEENGKKIPMQHLGFLLESGTALKAPLLLVGTVTYCMDYFKAPPPREVDPLPGSAKEISRYFSSAHAPFTASAPWGILNSSQEPFVPLAIQCKIRGWNDLAKELFQTTLQADPAPDGIHIYAQARRQLIRIAWAHWENELVKKGTDRANICRRMKLLHKEQPELGENYLGSLIKSLEATLAPTRAQPGSPEALIDELTEMTSKPFDYTGNGYEPEVLKILGCGFEAVPALVAHVEDIRLTRAVTRGMMKMPTHHRTVKETIQDILKGLADGYSGGNESWSSWAQAWWQEAQNAGEENYLLAHALPNDLKKEWPNRHILHVLATKYPQRLPQVYRTLLDERPHMQSYPVADIVAASSLSREIKLELFLYASGKQSLLHRVDAFRHLKQLDPKRFLELLVETLKATPQTPKEPYWACPEVSFGHFVIETDDPLAWKTLLDTAKRVDVGMRMEFINHMDYTCLGDRQRKQRIFFCAQFLNDAMVPDIKSNPKMFDGPHAGFTQPGLSVRNLAAETLASIMNLDADPLPAWNEELWSVLRSQVRQKLAAEGIDSDQDHVEK